MKEEYRQAYAQWLEMTKDDPQSHAELLAIADDDQEIEDRFYAELSFGTAGMRGIIGAGPNRMNIYNVRRATRGLADCVRQAQDGPARGVVIAYDSREKSDLFAREAALVLCAAGITARLFPSLRPVPVLSFAVRALGAAAGIVITASHNPPAYNGYKVYWADGAQIPPETADVMLSHIRAYSFAQSQPMDEYDALQAGLLTYVDAAVDDAYIEAVKTLASQPELLHHHGQDLSIVYTPLHGTGNLPVRRVLTEMNVTNLHVVRAQEAPDPAFSTVQTPNPERRETFDLAIALANEKGADVCFATDPDCDRLGVAMRGPDGNFRILTGNQIGCLLLHSILSARAELGTLPENPAVLRSIVSTPLADRIAAAYGAQMVGTLTGFKFIAEKIQQFEDSGSHAFLFGFEESYGYLSSTFVRDKDAVNASLLVTELALALKLAGKTLWDRMQEIYARFGYFAERNEDKALPGKDGAARRDAIMRALRAQPPAAIGGVAVRSVRDFLTPQTDALGDAMSASDVLGFTLEDGGQIFIRPSGTEPKIKLYVHLEGANQEDAEARADALVEAARVLLS